MTLKDVAASFIDKRIRNSDSLAYSISFDRHTLPPDPDSDVVAQFIAGDSVPSEVWSLEPRAEGQNVIWHVKKLGKNFTSSELASQVAIRLVKQFEAYEAAFGR